MKLGKSARRDFFIAVATKQSMGTESVNFSIAIGIEGAKMSLSHPTPKAQAPRMALGGAEAKATASKSGKAQDEC